MAITYIKPILRYLRCGHLARAVLAVFEARVEVGEALHGHGQVLRYFVQTQETGLWHLTGFEIFADLCSHGASDGLIESGECVQCRLY